MEFKLTGIVAVSAVTEATHAPEYAPMISRNLASPIHQHLFCMRFDWNLDGGPNTLVEENSVVVDDARFKAVGSVLKSEMEARRNVCSASGRAWKVINSSSQQRTKGVPVGYEIHMGSTPTLLPSDRSAVGRRGAFGRYNVWATRYRPRETTAAGEFSVMNPGVDEGLPHYGRQDESIVNCDLVTWHTFGVTHIPRPEDWPVMPVATTSMRVQPSGFFSASPIMDLPKGTPKSCHADDKQMCKL